MANYGRITIIVLSVFFFIPILSSCKSGNSELSTQKTELSATFTPPAPTEIKGSGVASTLSIVPSKETVTGTPTPITQPLLTPTLDELESQIYLIKLLSNNGHCKLPCFMGTRPGQTTWPEIKNLFTHLGKNAPMPRSYADYGVESYNYQYRFEKRLDLLGLTFYIRNNELTLLQAFIRPNRNDAIEKRYSLETLMLELGEPTQVFIELLGYGALGPAEETPFRLTFFYDYENYWLIAQYEGMSVQEGQEFKLCPMDLFQGIVTDRVDSSIKFFIQPGNNPYSVDDIHKMGVGGNPLLSGITFQDATGKELRELNNGIINSGENICFMTSKQLWK